MIIALIMMIMQFKGDSLISIIMTNLLKCLSNLYCRTQSGTNRFTFSQHTKDIENENIGAYLSQLTIFNKRMKLPTQQQINIQYELVQKLVNDKDMQKGIFLLQKINQYKFRTINTDSLSKLEKMFINSFKGQSSELYSYEMLSYYLVMNHCFELFDVVFQRFHQQDKQFQAQNMTDSKLYYKFMIFIIGQTIKNKNKLHLKDFQCERLGSTLKSQIVKESFKQEAKIISELFHNELKQSCNFQYLVSQKYHARSILQKDIECLLKTLNKSYDRQVEFNYSGKNYFRVDFLIDQPLKSNEKKALQIMGNYHYTACNKLKGFDILRALLINQSFPVRFVHQMNFNSAKGIRNKMIYLEEIISQQQVNWEPSSTAAKNKWILDL